MNLECVVVLECKGIVKDGVCRRSQEPTEKGPNGQSQRNLIKIR